MDFETEEQQVEALKKWWKENGTQVILGAVIGFGAIIGWRYYQDYSVTQLSQASALFEQVAKDNTGEKESVDKAAVFKKLEKNYKDTVYYEAAGLVAAKSLYKSGKKEEALKVLDDLILNNKQKVMVLIAKERKARILLDLNRADDALDVLSADVSENFTGIFEELKGDAYLLKGDTANAKLAYDKALLLNVTGSKESLQMKRDSLGESVVGSAA